MQRILASAFVGLAAVANGCTSLPGHAHIEYRSTNDGPVAFEGLAKGGDETLIFYTHGMGPTEKDFDQKLRDHGTRLLNAEQWTVVVDWTEVQLPEPWILRGEGLNCTDSNTNPCVKTSFGVLKIQTLANQGKTVTLYSYYWDDAADSIQRPYGMSCDKQLPGYCDKKESSGWQKAWINRQIKDGVVVDGFSDATLYAGDAGALMRAGMQAAMCLAMKHALFGAIPAGRCVSSDFLPDPEDLRTLERLTTLDLRLVAKSLGSRIVFDMLTPFDEIEVLERKLLTYSTAESARMGKEPPTSFTRTDVPTWLPVTPSEIKLSKDSELREAYAGIQLKKAIAQSLDETYLLANQLPLLGLARIQAMNLQNITARDAVYCAYVSDDPTCTMSPALMDPTTTEPEGPRIEADSPSFFSFAHSARKNKLKVVAFRDINDLLGFRASQHLSDSASDLADFIEVRHQNASVWLRLVAWPSSAHAEEDEHNDSAALIWCGGLAEPTGKVTARRCMY